MHVLCVYVSKLLSGLFWLFWDKVWLLLVNTHRLATLIITTQLRSGTVGKMAGILTKRMWQP